jgi:predicted deacylase
MVRSGMGDMIRVPVVVLRGIEAGPILGITAAVHGNELNGMRIIHRLVPELDVSELRGTVVAVPVVNVPGYLMNRREFNDGQDLNRIFPGDESANSAQVYAARFVDRVVKKFEYLIDLHTASFGRVNSMYVRADMRNPIAARMATLQAAQIIVHNEGHDRTLRSAAADLGIHAITLEVGDPQRFQRKLIRHGITGLHNLLVDLKMIPEEPEPIPTEPVTCERSYWMHTDRGGVLVVFPDVAEWVDRGQLVARVTDMFGGVVAEYHAPERGIVVGKSTNPVNQAGSRILHLGIPGEV